VLAQSLTSGRVEGAFGELRLSFSEVHIRYLACVSASSPRASTAVPVLPRTRTVESISQGVVGTVGLARRCTCASSSCGRLPGVLREPWRPCLPNRWFTDDKSPHRLEQDGTGTDRDAWKRGRVPRTGPAYVGELPDLRQRVRPGSTANP
jgi:hypothetical protein